MPYLLPDDLDTHIYGENLAEIVRNDDVLIEKAISAAVAEAKGYLFRFDLVALFGTEDDDPTHEDENLANKVKDIVLWNLVKLGNPNIQMELARTTYEDAIKWLTMVQSGKQVPGWPLKSDNPDTDYSEEGRVQWDSNPKRNNYY